MALLCSESACPWSGRAGPCLRPPGSGDRPSLGMEAPGKLSGSCLQHEPAPATITAEVPLLSPGPSCQAAAAGRAVLGAAGPREAARCGHFSSLRKSKPRWRGPSPSTGKQWEGESQAENSQQPPSTVTPHPCTVCSEPRTREGGLTGPGRTGLGLLGEASSGLPCLEDRSGAWSPEGPGQEVAGREHAEPRCGELIWDPGASKNSVSEGGPGPKGKGWSGMRRGGGTARQWAFPRGGDKDQESPGPRAGVHPGRRRSPCACTGAARCAPVRRPARAGGRAPARTGSRRAG